MEFSERTKLFIGLGVITFVLVAIFLGGMYVGNRITESWAEPCPDCKVCDKGCPEPEPCPMADHEFVEIMLYPTASVACNKVPESERWLCSPVVFRDSEGEPGKMPDEVTVRLLKAPEDKAKENKDGG